MSVLSSKNNEILECFRPRGKIVCVGESLLNELQIIQNYQIKNAKSRLPLLLLTPSTLGDNFCDQVVTFNSEAVLKQVHSLLNSYFLIFIFNSNEEGILRILGIVMASINYSGSIPIFIDTGNGFNSNQKSLFGKNYFQIDCSNNNGREEFLIFLEFFTSSLNASIGLGVSFSDLIRIFGNSRNLYFGISSSNDLNAALTESIDQIGEKLVLAMPEEIEVLDAILVFVTSGTSLSLQKMNDISLELTKTFGQDFEVYFSSSKNVEAEGEKIVVILTDVNPIQDIFPLNSSSELSSLDIVKSESLENIETNKILNSEDSEVSDEDERFNILGKIFLNSEIYIFDDGGLPLFASHRPAGKEVCLYTGLFSAIQSMSSDLIGHTPDHLTAGNKQCVFISKSGPHNSQVRGVAIYSEGFEHKARNDLDISMNLVKECMRLGDPEYAINDKIQGVLVQGYNSGTLGNLVQELNFQAS